MPGQENFNRKLAEQDLVKTIRQVNRMGPH